MNTGGEKLSGSCLAKYATQCPAKLNIGLQITGRREDGYHELQSLFWPIAFYDHIHWTEKKIQSPPKLTTQWLDTAPKKSRLPQEQQNLLSRCLEALKHKGFSAENFDFSLMKNIPIGAGLGGGSSNVGSFLRSLMGESLISEALAFEIAENLGSDIPFFLNPTPSWITGIGEEIAPLEIDPQLKKNLHFILVIPQGSISTPSAFGEYRKSSLSFRGLEFPFESLEVNQNNFLNYLKTATNDLEPVATEKVPEIKQILTLLKNTGAIYSGMSGSGSSCFSIYLENPNKIFKDLQDSFRKLHCKSIHAKTH